MGSSNENSGYGIVRNPWDRERVPGGSSGGSAAAVAAGLAPWAIGTDTGGSIRQPAALCGIVGLKPTYGAVSRYGMVAFASSLDQCGPLTRTSPTRRCCCAHLVGHDPCDSTSLGLPEEVRAAEPHGPEGAALRRAARSSAPSAEGVEAGVGAGRSTRTLELIEQLGGELVEVELPHAPHGIAAYYVIAPAEASSNLARYDGVRFGQRAGNGTLLDLYEHDARGGLRRRGEAPHHARHVRAVGRLLRGLLRPRPARAHEDRRRLPRPRSSSCDFIVTPTSPTVAFKLGERTGRPARDVPVRLLHGADVAGRHPRDLDPGRPRQAGRRQRPGARPAGRLPDRRARRSPRTGILDAAYALEQAIGFDTTGALAVSAGDRWEPVIGLEIHVQLSTRTKMFCACALSFGEPPNTRTCPVCLGHPGTLPTLNARGGALRPDDRASRSAARSRRGRSSTARTTSIPTCRRATRSASTTSRWRRRGALAGSRRARRCASTARTSRRMPPS